MIPAERIASSLVGNAVAYVRGPVDLSELTPVFGRLAKRALVFSEADYLGEPNSLTPRKWLSYGHESYDLPLHTDYPDYLVPPRFVSMTCHTVGTVPVETVFYDVGRAALHDPELDVLLSEPWLTSGGVEKTRLVRLLEFDEAAGAPLLRYAANVMRPFYRSSSKGEHVLRRIVSACRPTAVVLMPSDTVIWDNWRILHGRRIAAAPPDDWRAGSERTLERHKWT